MSRKIHKIKEHFESKGIDFKAFEDGLGIDKIIDYYSHNNISDTQKQNIRSLIINMLDVDDEFEIGYILDDIRTKCEYLEVVEIIQTFTESAKRITHTGGYREKEKEIKKFKRTKDRVIRDLAYLKINDEELLNAVHDKKFQELLYRAETKDSQYKVFKSSLINKLSTHCMTGKVRAENISRLLKSIKIN